MLNLTMDEKVDSNIIIYHLNQDPIATTFLIDNYEM